MQPLVEAYDMMDLTSLRECVCARVCTSCLLLEDDIDHVVDARSIECIEKPRLSESKDGQKEREGEEWGEKLTHRCLHP